MNKIYKLVYGPQVPLINIRGIINSQTTEKFAHDLKSINTGVAQALAIQIDSMGGSLNQSEIIGQKLKYFCKHHKLPLYTFCGDTCLSSAYYLLAMGDKVFADKSSYIGYFGIMSSHLSLKQFIEQQKIENRQFATDNKLLQRLLSNYEKLQVDEKEYIKKILDQQNLLFMQNVKEFRGNKIVNEQPFKDGVIYTGVEAKEIGLIDDTKDFQQYIYEQHPSAKVDMVGKQSIFSKYKAMMELQFNVQMINKDMLNTQMVENSASSLMRTNQNINL